MVSRFSRGPGQNPSVQIDGDTFWIPTSTELLAPGDFPLGLPARLTTAENTLTSQGRGLSAPNPASALLLPLPTAMASPPTITPGAAGAATTIAGSVLYGVSGNTADVFSYYGCPVAQGTGYPNDLFYSAYYSVTAGVVNIAINFAVEFEWYGQTFELFIKGNGVGAIYQLIVDGQYDDRAGRSDTASDGNGYLIEYNFGSVGFRRIRFEFLGNLHFGGVRIGPNDSIWKPSRPRGPKVIVTGDSFAETLTHWPQMMGWLLGWKDVSIVGRGSTGYLDTNAGADTLRDRAQKDIINQSPDIVIVSGGLNDNTFSAAAVQAEAITLFQMIRNGLPNAVLIVSGFNITKGAPGASTWVTTRDAIRAAANSAHGDGTLAHLYIEQMGGPYPYSGVIANYTDVGWMTGEGKVGTTTGTGNSDVFRDADGTHPSQAGHDYRGYRHAQAIAAAMPILGAS